MKRRLLTALFAFVTTFCLMFGMVACNSGGSSSDSSSDGNTNTEQTDNDSGNSGSSDDNSGSADDGSSDGDEDETPEHTHTLTHYTANEATCTKEGNIEYWYCSGCGKYFADKNATEEVTEDEIYITASHTEGETVIENETKATCTEGGSYDKVIYCTVCGEELSRKMITTDVGEHSYSSSWSYDENNHWHECEVCGEKSDSAPHAISNSICTVCGYIVSGTEGLEYTLSNDGTYYTVSGIGTATKTTELIIPSVYNGKAVTAIADSAFCDNTYIVHMVMGNGINSIGNQAFSGCTSLESINITESVTSIGELAFRDCCAEIIWTGNSTIKEIGSYAFANYIGVNLTIPNSVTSIGQAAFYECTAEIIWGDSPAVTEIGWWAFAYYAGESIIIPECVTYIVAGAFENCYVKNIYVDENNLYYLSIDGVLFNKDATELIAYPVGNDNTSYIMPDSVIYIASYAFYWCTYLESVAIGDNVEYIGHVAFAGCKSITEFIIPDSVNTIDSQAFIDCLILESITIGSGLISIGSFVFSGCPLLENIYVDEDNAYFCDVDGVLFSKDMTQLVIYPVAKANESYTVPDGVKSIDDSAFEGCTLLKNIILPDSVIYIGSWAFQSCTFLTSIEIPNSVEYIGYQAFGYCSMLTSITIPESVTYIDDYTFFNCTLLENIYIDDDNEYYCSIGGVLFNKDVTILIAYPTGNTRTNYVIQNGVISINSGAFEDCDYLESIVIPSSIKNIYSNAFNYCYTLSDVYYCGTADEWDEISISSGNTYLTNATIYYYSESEPTEEGNYWHYVDGVATAW